VKVGLRGERKGGEYREKNIIGKTKNKVIINK